MKKMLFVLLCMSLFATGSAIAGNEREEDLIESLNVNTRNTVNGEVISKDESNVNVGGVQIGGANIQGELKVNVTNEVNGIEATGGSEVMVGGFSGRGMTSGGDVTLTAPLNKVTGKINATEGSHVYVGSAKLDGMNFGKKVDITTTNTVNGGITAQNGSDVNIGSVTN